MLSMFQSGCLLVKMSIQKGVLRGASYWTLLERLARLNSMLGSSSFSWFCVTLEWCGV